MVPGRSYVSITYLSRGPVGDWSLELRVKWLAGGLGPGRINCLLPSDVSQQRRGPGQDFAGAAARTGERIACKNALLTSGEEARRTFRRIRIRMQIKHFKCTTQTDSDECQRKGGKGVERVGAERSGIYVGRKGGEQWADGAIMGPSTHSLRAVADWLSRSLVLFERANPNYLEGEKK